MANNLFRRLARLRARLANEVGDVEPGDIVKAIWGGPLGFVESVTDDHAVVFWHNRLAQREIVERKNIRRAAADPSFGPDVRDGE